ncbi:tripartite motif-containing protein 10-like [Tiliqua scincoides]|uniref:tripartite motif-containing protein 10-like n=1 Tax=Tiliqua scincoides TaxID=71010 RepID=UPI0034620BC5
MARLVEELSSHEGLIQEMEEKCQQPASELLQDVRSTLLRRSQGEQQECGVPAARRPETALSCNAGTIHSKGLRSCLNPSLESSSAMASASPTLEVEEELKCPICMEYLTDPVTLDCGHNFCRDCITTYCETWEDLGDLECPLCTARIKKGNFRPNWQLANVVEKIKCLSFYLGKEHLCLRHKEKLSLFCKEDQELVCLFCERSPEHQSHKVLFLEEAAKECKDQLCSCLEVLRKERERILASKAGTEKESRDLLGQIEEKKTTTEAVFNQLHQFLEKQKTSLLSQLEELEKEIATRREEHMARLEEELSSLEGLIQQMEEKCQQPASELLQSGIPVVRSVRSDIFLLHITYEKKEAFGNPVAFPPELTCRIGEFFDVKPLLEGVMEQFPASEAKVTLDPDTAHPQLILSEDHKSVIFGDELQTLPDNPERFDGWPFVLGRQGFTAGRHFWEVTVGGEGNWAVGVARKSVRRKVWYDLSSEEGIWALEKSGGQYSIFNAPHYPPLSLSQELQRIRVTLDCAGGQVAFSDADTGVHLYTHSGASICGETLLPFFQVLGLAHLSLPP